MNWSQVTYEKDCEVFTLLTLPFIIYMFSAFPKKETDFNVTKSELNQGGGV